MTTGIVKPKTKQGLKGLFKKEKIQTSSSAESVSRKVESVDYVHEFIKDKKRFFPNIDFSNPTNFARFGSAEEYYKKSIENIYKTYPYDGSLKEKYEWHNSSSYIDNYIFDQEYPRTNGYIVLGQDWGNITSTVDATGDGDSIYKKSTAPQYISIKGGPNAASHLTYELDNPQDSPDLKKKRFKANFYNSTGSQEQNLNIDGVSGNTIEFWLKLPSTPASSQTSPAHAYFDLWNGQVGTSHAYGRILIESIFDVDGSGTPDGSYLGDSIFYISYASGSTGVQRAKVGPSTFPASENITLSDWNHYAFVMQNNPTGSDHILMKLYVNGNLIDTVHTGSQISNVATAPLNANIGAYRTAPTHTLSSRGVGEGFGSLSGSSFDEFRFWKKARNSEEIGLNWFKQVAGGTNSDFGTQNSKYSGSSNPVDLGVYYKFNEGITNKDVLDRVVLDYSGRVSNGRVENYGSSPQMRFTGSAMVSSSASEYEFRDPILYKNHPSVKAYYDNSIYKGREYDTRNSMGMYRMMPQWILDEDSDESSFEVRKLTQIISSYFDELFIQTKEISKLKDIVYVSGSLTGSSYKPLPFANRLLTSHGFDVPELFANADVLATLANRDDVREYEKTLSDVKNQLYTNVYNNLTAINKSKGTEKSIRNLLRSLGIDTELYSINFYANNAELTLNQSILPTTIEKNFVDFSHTSNFGGSVYQSTSSTDSNTVPFITGSSNHSAGFDKDIGFTVEVETVFPKQLNYENPAFASREFVPLTASIFGMHTVPTTQSDEGDTSWAEEDFANFQVYAVRDKFNKDGIAGVTDDEVYFMLTCLKPNTATAKTFATLKSQKYSDVYDGQKWNFAVKVLPETYPNLGFVSGTSGHRIEFHGYNTIGDEVVNSFILSSSVSDGRKVLSRKKRVYIGSHRQNFTGSLLQGTNIKISACRYWGLPLETDEIIAHAIDASNYGVFNPNENAYLFQDFKINVPKMDTLALNWEFNTLTGSDSNGDFEVSDLSYGSGTIPNRYGTDLSVLLNRQHTGRGFGFGSNSTECITKDFLFSYKQQVPDNLDISDTIKVLQRDDEMFTPRTRPIKFSMSIEKSMYEVISEEMLNFMAACTDASALETLVGRGVNKYRDKYKSLEKVRNLFYEKVSNTPDIDKYLEYYKWLDGAISDMLQQVVPMSSGFKDIENIIESHILERNKYQHRFPTMEFKSDDPIGVIKGVNELTYDWEHGHALDPKPIKAAQATMLFLTDSFGFYGSSRFTITSTNGTSKRYIFDVGGSAGTGTLDGSDVVIQVNGLSDRDDIADQVIAAINSANGHNAGSANSVINLSYDDSTNTLTMTQVTPGVSGNTSIVQELQNVILSINNFSGGSGFITPRDFLAFGAQSINCNWWNKKVTRDDARLPVGDQGVDFSRMNIHSASLQVFNRDFNKPYKLTIDETETKTRIKKNSFVLSHIKPFDNLKSIAFDSRTFVSSSVHCTDDQKINPNLKRKADFQAEAYASSISQAVSAPKAVASIIFLSDAGNFYGSSTITITSTSGVTKTYIFDIGGSAATGTLDGSDVVVQVQGLANRDLVAAQFVLAMNSANGHNAGSADSVIVVSYNSSTDTLSLQQVVAGFSGNTNIETFLQNPGLVSVFSFTGGGGSNTQPKFSGDLIVPYSFYSSSVNPLNLGLPTGLTTGPEHLRDYYVDTQEIPIQGPFTRTHVGGNSRRHVPLVVEPVEANTPSGNPRKPRPQAWFLVTATADGHLYYTIRNPTFFGTTFGQNLPRLDFTRDFIAKSPVNIKNIQTNTASVALYDSGPYAPLTNEYGGMIPIGNYVNSYEIVQTADRSTNNRYFVENNGISTSSAASPGVFGLKDYAVPDRGRHSSIIVNRFSSPGGPEVSSPGYLDFESETFSVYNALPFRNLTVRQPLRGFLTNHSTFGGLDSRFGARARLMFVSANLTAYNSNTIAITSTEGKTVTFLFDNTGVSSRPTGKDDGTGRIFIQINGMTTQNQIGKEFLIAFNSALGMNAGNADSVIRANHEGNGGFIINMQQNVGGEAGNTAIVAPTLISAGTILIVAVPPAAVAPTGFEGGRGEVGQFASFHNTQRNGAKRIEQISIFQQSDSEQVPNVFTTASSFDNYWVQHMIPQSDLQYSWITGSATGFPFGYSQPDPSSANQAATDLVFAEPDFGLTMLIGQETYGITKAFAESSNLTFAPVDYVGLNRALVADHTKFEENLLVYSRSPFSINGTVTPSGDQPGTKPTLLYAQNLRNGPYGEPTWVQLRQSFNPLVRDMHKNNRYSILTDPPKGTLVNYTEPAVSFKNYPVVHNFILSSQDNIILKSTYDNDFEIFANKPINDIIPYKGRQKNNQVYDDLKKIYIENKIDQNQSTIKRFVSMKHKQTVYPKNANTGLAKVRMRENYTVSQGTNLDNNFDIRLGDSIAFWKDNINLRLRLDSTAKSAGNLVITSGSTYYGISDLSIWPLDAEQPFFDLIQASSSEAMDLGTAGDANYLSPLGPSGATLSPTIESRWKDVSKNGELSYAGWIYSLLQPNIQGKARPDRSSIGGGSAIACPTSSGPLNKEDNEIIPTASIQFEYPNLVPSGTTNYRKDLAGTTRQSRVPSGNLSLIPPYRADVISGRTPWFNSYEDYARDIRKMAKEYSVLPEFRISDHMDHYLENGVLAKTNNFMDLIGSSLNNTASADSVTGHVNTDFFKIYSHSDFLNSFSVFKEDHGKNNTGKFNRIKLECKAVKKLLPYQGFYPALRSVQLGSMFSSSFGRKEYLTGSSIRDGNMERLAALYQPFFAPGVFFNTIKSGIAVSYPVHTASGPTSVLSQADTTNKFTHFVNPGTGTFGPHHPSFVITDTPNYTFPFEAILNPAKYLPVTASRGRETHSLLSPGSEDPSNIFFIYPHLTSSLSVRNHTDGFYLRQSDATNGVLGDGASDFSSGSIASEIFVEWKGINDSKYSLAANNFFAEVENFFLEDRSPTHFVSQEASKFKSMEVGKRYYMDVVMYKTDDFMSYEVPSGSFEFFVYPDKNSATTDDDAIYYIQSQLGDKLMTPDGAKMSVRGMHYGPPYLAGVQFYGNAGTGSVALQASAFEDPAYAPHCPPYFYGTSVARISFVPKNTAEGAGMDDGDTLVFDLDTILGNAQIETVFYNENESVPMLRNSRAFDLLAAPSMQMQLSSSVSLFGKLQSKQKQFNALPDENGIYNPESVETPSVGQDGFNKWVIETKFECPSINMFDMDTQALGAGSPGDGTFAAPGSERLYTKGIWKGYGEPPSSNKGIYFGLRESFPEKLTAEGLPKQGSLTGSLLNVCGFESDSERRIGEIASSRKMHEAIVAVPLGAGRFGGGPIPIPKLIFRQQRQNLSSGKPAVVAGDFGAESDITRTSISDMITKMNKYYIPPQMDFLRNEEVDPFVMYIFEFEHTFSKSDLSYIWQNLMPDISLTAEKQTSFVEHDIGSKFEFFGSLVEDEEFGPDTKWMIFKVKQRARNNYAALTKTSERASGFNIDTEEDLAKKGIYISRDQELRYSYNWPYDFCSLVELAKLDVETTFSPQETLREEKSVLETITSTFDYATGEYVEQDRKLQEIKKENLNQSKKIDEKLNTDPVVTGLKKIN